MFCLRQIPFIKNQNILKTKQKNKEKHLADLIKPPVHTVLSGTATKQHLFQ